MSLDRIQELFAAESENIQSRDNIESLKKQFCGKDGLLNQAMMQIKTLSGEEKKEFGQKLNQLKSKIESKLTELAEEFLKKELEQKSLRESGFDVTLQRQNRYSNGSLHLYTQFAEEVENIFISMGFEIFQGPEVETEFFNFTALNIPQDHPARDMYDTLWLNQPGKLLRTHTSPVQVRSMLAKGAPIAGIALGRVFRHEALDATHEIIFNQCEGIFIDKNVSLGDLLGVAKKVLQELFGSSKLDIRTRPGFFPFVEPGVEIDMRCVFCSSGCSVCKKSGWIEVFPGGMIHPKVLEHGGIDPKQYSGFAFGFGVDRLAMLRHRINDIRHFKSGDMRFLKQF